MKSVRLRELKCLLCGSKNHRPYLQVVNRFNIQEKFYIVLCSQCDFAYLSPCPVQKDMYLYYEDDRYQPHQASGLSLSDHLYRWLRTWNIKRKRHLIEGYHTAGSILDVGCGTGEFLQEMKKSSWKACGIELSSTAREYAMEGGLKVYESVDNCKGPFDVITLWHVLEHIEKAHDLLDQLNRLLSDEGILIIAFPNRESIDAKSYGSNWVAYDAPRHLYHFRPRDMQLLLEQHGFTVIGKKFLILDTWFNTLYSWRLKSHVDHKKVNFSGFIRCGIVALYATIKEIFNYEQASSPIFIVKRMHDNKVKKVPKMSKVGNV